MLPPLVRLSGEQARFLDSSNAEIARIEGRGINTVALVGTRCQEACVLTVPMEGRDGFAHIKICDQDGTCRDPHGISLCKSVIASLQHRGRHVVFTAGYASVELTPSLDT